MDGTWDLRNPEMSRNQGWDVPGPEVHPVNEAQARLNTEYRVEVRCRALADMMARATASEVDLDALSEDDWQNHLAAVAVENALRFILHERPAGPQLSRLIDKSE